MCALWLKCTYKIVIMSLLYHRLIKLSFVFVGGYRVIAAAIIESRFAWRMMSASDRRQCFIGWFLFRMIANANVTWSGPNISVSRTTIWICCRILGRFIACVWYTCIIIIRIDVIVSKITVIQWTGTFNKKRAAAVKGERREKNAIINQYG